MPLTTFDEIPQSRTSTANPPTHQRIYVASGEFDDALVGIQAASLTPSWVLTPVGILWRQDIKLDEQGHALYRVTIPYGKNQKQQGTYTFDFDTSGATVKIKAAREHLGSFPSGGGLPADPHKCAIGVQDDGTVEGVDVILPALKLGVKFSQPQGVVTIAYCKLLSRATGCTNASPFLEFAAGELLFLGASGSAGSDAPTEVAYNFAASENVDDLSFGDITGIVKAGHHLAWVEFKDEVADGQPARQPRRVHVERVYNEIDFATYLGWG